MKRFAQIILVIFLVSLPAICSSAAHPGTEPYIPTRIDWLTTVLDASLRSDRINEDRYLLLIASPDPETILIYVRHFPDVNRQSMNVGIEAARDVIKIKAKMYGWDKWLKIREDIQVVK